MKRIITSLCAIIMAVLMLGSMGQTGHADGVAPIAENFELKTYKNVSVGGELSAYDPDDDVVSFEISTNPIKGKIVLNDDGSFIYTPAENKKGRDYFGYKASDRMGNVSQEATVIIKIEKQQTDIKYSDMKNEAAEYAAVELAEQGIFVGERVGGNYCFNPQRAVNRGEFLAMCMMVSEEEIMDAVMSTGDEKNDTLPNWLKSYVCTATINGLDTNYNWNENIKFNEAAAIVNSVLNLNDVSYTEDNQVQACINLNACGINTNFVVDKELSRAEAAQMLCKAIEVVSNR